jgi:hypothetical protein
MADALGYGLVLGLIMSLSKSKREELRQQFDGGCAFCGSELPNRGWHAENIGEEYVAGGLVAVCTECWSSKGKASPEAFRAMLDEQVERAQRHSSNFRMALRFGLVSQTRAPVKFWFERCTTEQTPTLRTAAECTNNNSSAARQSAIRS